MTAAVPRLAVIHCPQWPVVGALAGTTGGTTGGEPVAVVRANRVVARSVAAGAAGVRVGQRRREAQSRCPQLRLVTHDPTADARAFHPVADAVAQLVPRLEITRPGVITFPTRGPSRYFGGDEAMAERVLAVVTAVLADRIPAVGRPGVGIADGRFAAGVAARRAVRAGFAGQAPVEVVSVGGSAEFLAPLPLRWLVDGAGAGAGVAGAGVEVPAEQVDLFRRLGITRLGELAALPASDVMARFGRVGAAAQRMAAGADERPPGTEDPPPGLAVVQQFDTPMPHLDAVVFAARQLAEQLVGALADRGRVCTQVVVTAETEHGERTERLWSLSAGFSTAAVVERVRWQLNGWASISDVEPEAEPTAGVIQLCLEPTEVRADDGIQLGLWGGRSQADEWAQRAAARLAGLVGDEQVVVAERRGGRQPADAHHWVPASLSPQLDPGARNAPGASSGAPSGAPWPGSLPAPSPAEIHPEPIEADVRDAHGRPVSVSGRGVASGAPTVLRVDQGETPIVAWAGPWVVDERWWDAARHRRIARFQLLTADGVAHLATVERRRWWLVARYG